MLKTLLLTSCCLLGAWSAAAAETGVTYNRPPASASPKVYLKGPRGDVTNSIRPLGVPVAPVFAARDWTGPNLGLTVGAGWMNTNLNVPGLGNFSGVGLYGVTAGVTAGFDYQFGARVVAGVAADGNVHSVSARDTIAGAGELSYRETGSWSLRGRLGVLASDDTLIYATAGLSEVFTALNMPLGVRGGNAAYFGPVFGGGVETHLAGDIYARVEYLHGVYSRKNFAGGLYSAAPSASTAKVGLIWKPGIGPGGGDVVTPVVRDNWTGGYVGAHGGWVWNNTRVSSANVFWSDGIGGNGPSGGVLAGYDYQLGSSVAGVEADVSAQGGSATLNGAVGGFPFGARVAYDWAWGARLRFGQVFGNTLLFATAGVAQSHGRLTSFGLGMADTSHTFLGVQFGGGAETMLTQNVAARVEYLHSIYGTFSSINGSTTDAGLTSGKTRAAMIYKF